jgi:hypothetical protein
LSTIGVTRPLNSTFDVLWEVISASDDDQIFVAPTDEQFSVIQETQIPRAQIPFTVLLLLPGVLGLEGLLGLLW